ncbi:hypothetical protein [Rummeliibacillus pycnus]|uniref:hypothetical protein n=1 Tax=Rummeliibacillus pycnus TaxID=101070 RepID=UPI003D28B4F5
MNHLEQNLTSNVEIADIRNKITSIIYSLHFDCCYHVEDCIIDLHKLLLTLDDLEI